MYIGHFSTHTTRHLQFLIVEVVGGGGWGGGGTSGFLKRCVIKYMVFDIYSR